MDYSRPNHIPSAAELTHQARLERHGLVVFAVLVVLVTVAAAIVFGSQITF